VYRIVDTISNRSREMLDAVKDGQHVVRKQHNAAIRHGYSLHSCISGSVSETRSSSDLSSRIAEAVEGPVCRGASAPPRFAGPITPPSQPINLDHLARRFPPVS